MGWRDDPVVGEKAPAWASDPVVGQAPKKKKPKTNKAGLVGGAINEGIADVLGSPVDLLNSGLSAVGLGSEKPFGGSESIRSGMNKLGLGQVYDNFKPQTKGEEYLSSAARGVGQAVGGLPLLPAASLRAASTLKPTAGATKRALAKLSQGAVSTPAKFVAAEAAAGAGSGIGGQAARDVAPGNPYAEAAGMLIGGVAGGLPVQTGRAVKGTAKAAQEGIEMAADAKRLVKAKGLAKAPDAPYIAEFAQDLKAVSDARAPNAPKGRAVVTVKQVNDVIDGYMEQYGNIINRLDMKPSEKTTLMTAMGQKWSITPDKLKELLDPVSDPVAKKALEEGIRKTQVAYDYTPELPRGGVGRAVSNVAELGSTVAGAAMGGPGGAVLGGAGGNIAKRFLRSLSADAGEAARVNSAEKLVKNAKLYKKLGELTGPSPQKAADAALKARYASIVDAPKVKASTGNALDELVKRNIASGVEGNPAITESFAARSLGVPADDAKRALQFIAEKHPALADDANALRMGYTTFTQRGKFGRAATPLMKKFLTEDGTYDRLKQAAAAQPAPQAAAPVRPQPQVAPPGPEVAIRNPEAYRATAQGNQARVSQTLSAIQGHAAIPEPVKQSLSEAVTAIGNSSKRADAEAVVASVMSTLPQEQQGLAQIYLAPLLNQIKK